jgi:hypothetical protein
MAVVLLIKTALLAKSFLHLQRPDTNFQTKNLLTITVSLSGSPRANGDRHPAFLSELLDSIGTLPGVKNATFVNHVPIGGDTRGTRFEVEGRPSPDPARLPYAVMRTASPGYLASMGIPLLHGRDFDARDRKDTAPVVLVNRVFARGLRFEGRVFGVRIKMGGPDTDAFWRTVVGVFADARQADLVEPVQPEILSRTHRTRWTGTRGRPSWSGRRPRSRASPPEWCRGCGWPRPSYPSPASAR